MSGEATQTPEMLPCPFCGSTHTHALLYRGKGPDWIAECGNCLAGIITISKPSAIAAWNQRDDHRDRLMDACNGLLGLLQLVSGRDDISDELRGVLKTNHRVEAAEILLASLERPAK